MQQPTNIGNKNSVSSSNFKRETSPTVCCYNINSRSQSFRKNDQSEGNFGNFASAQRAEEKLSQKSTSSAPLFSSNLANLHKNRSQYQFASKSLIQNRENSASEKSLKDKIRKFENPPNNIHENIINRTTTSTTTIRTEEAKADVDPVKSVSENDQRIYDDKNSRFSCTLLINRDESQSKRIAGEQCNLKFESDGNNNQVKTNDSLKSSLTARQQLRDTKDINKRCCVNGGDIKVTKVVIRHLAPIANKTTDERNLPKQNSLDDNDFSFIDSSSRSVSRSSSASFASDDLNDEKVNQQRKFRIPKISRINNCNYSQEFSVKTCANQNIYTLDQSENCSARNGSDTKSHKSVYLNSEEKSKNGQHLKVSTNSLSSSSCINLSDPENTVSSSSSHSPIKLSLLFHVCTSLSV